jgi:hypothetical protein
MFLFERAVLFLDKISKSIGGLRSGLVVCLLDNCLSINDLLEGKALMSFIKTS